MLEISTKTLYNKLRVYEAGARWRDPHAGTPTWAARDGDKSMQRGRPARRRTAQLTRALNRRTRSALQ